MNIKNFRLYIFIFFLVFLFGWWSQPNSIVNTSPDSDDYIALARDFNDPISEIRPVFFPLLLRFCMEVASKHWKYLYIFIQLTLHSLIACLLFKFLRNFKISKISSSFLTIVIGCNPSLLYYSTYILSDYLLALLTTIIWLMIFELIKRKPNEKVKNVIVIIIGIFCGFTSITKPVSIFLFLPVILFISFQNSIKNKVKICLTILALNFLVFFSWEFYKKINSPKLVFEPLDTLSYSINMTSIRAGLFEYGNGTPLYKKIIEDERLTEKAKTFKINLSYTMDTQSGFMDFKNSFHDTIKYDKQFANKVLSNAPLKLLIASMSNWHSFFTKRSFGPSPTSFVGMPKIVKTFYSKGYAYLYRPFLLLGIIISVAFLHKNNEKELLLLFLLFTLYASLTTAIFSPHGGEFPRYRVWIEYIIWIIVFIPVGYFIDSITKEIKKYNDA